MEIASDAKEFLICAKRDLDSAKFLLQMRPCPLEVICYLCQQSGEKTLKAFMGQNKIPNIKTHDLVILLEKCKSVAKEFEVLKTECVRLKDYASNIRYASSSDVDEAEMRLALNDAQKIWDFVQEKLGGAK